MITLKIELNWTSLYNHFNDYFYYAWGGVGGGGREREGKGLFPFSLPPPPPPREGKGLCPFSLPHPHTPGRAFSQAKQYDFKTKTFAMKPINWNMVY